jgi:hypothetical protein
MMTCDGCGRTQDTDSETGDDTNALCPDCQFAKDEAQSDEDWDRRMTERDDDPDGPWGGGFAPNH